MEIKCYGGMLAGHVLTKDNPEQTIHQNGLFLLRIHQPYPKRQGEKVTERLLTFTDSYALYLDPEAGLVYRCAHPMAGPSIGGELLIPTEGGGFDAYADRDGTLYPRPLCEECERPILNGDERVCVSCAVTW